MKRLLALPVVALAAASLTGCRSASPAITVDGTDISIADFEDDLEAIGSNEWFTENQAALFTEDCAERTEAGEPCRLLPETVAQWASQRTFNAIIAAEADARGVEPTDAQRDDVRAQLPEGFLDGFPKAFADRWVENDAIYAALVASLPTDDPSVDPAAQLQTELLAEAEVTIDPRYGTWSADAGVSPPLPIAVRDGRGPQLLEG
jgi:hypothetical protein